MMRHRDFERILNEFKNYYCKGTLTCPKGEYEYYQWLHSLSLDETLEYSQARESFTWAKDNIRFWKEDTENKYYKVLVGFPVQSMNGNVYHERDLIAGTKALIGLHPSLNHKDEFWFSPDNPENKWGVLSIVGAEYEDGASEVALQVPKSAVCPICNGAKMTELIDSKRIVNVSLEGACTNMNDGTCNGFHYGEKGFSLLTTDVLPGIPMARIFPMESYVPTTKPLILRIKRPPTTPHGLRVRIVGLEATDPDCKWVTIRGTHVCIRQGEDAATAFKRTTGKDLNGEEPKDLSAGKTQGKGEEPPIAATPTGKEISNVFAEWQKEGATPPPDIGNGIVTLTFSEFAAKFPNAKITRIGEFGLEAEVEGVDRHGVKFKDLYTAYASRKR